MSQVSVYSSRIALPKHDHCLKECLSLEKDVKTGKIDHPPSGSKDCSDALAGVAYGLTTRREIWAAHRIPLFNPQGLQKSPKMDSPTEQEAVKRWANPTVVG
jgi:hypothetical protein